MMVVLVEAKGVGRVRHDSRTDRQTDRQTDRRTHRPDERANAGQMIEGKQKRRKTLFESFVLWILVAGSDAYSDA
jgi:hypothetical protein